MTALARARESERTFFSPRRVDRAGREWGRSGNHRRAASRPTAVGTPRVARARLTTIVDDARGARAASLRARRRPRSISESASLRLPRRVFSRIFVEERSRASYSVDTLERRNCKVAPLELSAQAPRRSFFSACALRPLVRHATCDLQLVTSYGECAAAYDFRYVSKEYRVDVPPFAYEASYTRRAGGDAASRAR